MIDRKKDFLDIIVNFAIVIKADIKTINELKNYLAQNLCVDVVFQKYSFNKLYIKEDDENHEQQ